LAIPTVRPTRGISQIIGRMDAQYVTRMKAEPN